MPKAPSNRVIQNIREVRFPEPRRDCFEKEGTIHKARESTCASDTKRGSMVALAGDGLLFAEVRAAVVFRVELHLCSGLKDRSLWVATPSVACSEVSFAVCCS